jgi:hypothetical protein
VYLTEDLAVEALIQAHVHFDYSRSGGPVTVYRCDDCGYYHLTSQGQMHVKLDEYLKSSRNKYDKEAEKWIKKFKSK